MKRTATTLSAVAFFFGLALAAAHQTSFAAEPCCVAQEFQGVDLAQPPSGVTIQLVEIKRISPTEVRATWTLRNTTKTPQRLTKGGSGSSDGLHLAWDAALLDPLARVKYPVTMDGSGNPLASRHPPAGPISGIVVGASRTLTSWATFSVPATVSKVTANLPGSSMPWDDVSITSP